MASPSIPFPTWPNLGGNRTRSARARLEKRGGAAAQADVVALGGDGLTALHRNITAAPIYGMNLGTIGF